MDCRSTKAGGGTPATRGQHLLDRVGAHRSTKAGGGTPATPANAVPIGGGQEPLNEGRRWNSGDTCKKGISSATTPSAQRRPEVELRRHRSCTAMPACGRNRSTKAGGGTPATLADCPCARAGCPRSTKAGGGTPATPSEPEIRNRSIATLNEGRRWNSGDTAVPPGVGQVNVTRSTKAGGGTPATHARRFFFQDAIKPLNEGRRWNSGDTRFCRAIPANLAALNEGRRWNSGDTWTTSRPARPMAPLNEGRRWNSGDTGFCVTFPFTFECAQRRPEVELRRHWLAGKVPHIPETPLNEGRRWNSGDTVWQPEHVVAILGAQRRPEVELRRHAL